MERARTIFFALIALAIVIALLVWVHSLDRRVADLATQVNDLSTRMEGGGGRTGLVRPGEGGLAPGMRRRGEGGSPPVESPGMRKREGIPPVKAERRGEVPPAAPTTSTAERKQ